MSLRTGTMDGATPPSSAKAVPAVAQTVGPTPAAVPSVEDEREELSLSLVATILEAGERLRLPQVSLSRLLPKHSPSTFPADCIPFFHDF